MRRSLLAMTTAAGLCLASASHAAIIDTLSDGFEGDGATTFLNYNAWNNWNVTNGTVDKLAVPNIYGLTCNGGSVCVDLDGSTGDAGDFATKDQFAPGVYKLRFDLSGNQRGGSDTVSVTLNIADYSEVFILAANDAWQTFTRTITLTSNASLIFANTGGDNIGALLDNVSVSPVPLPAPLLLLGAALAGLLGFGRLRKRRAAAAA